MMSSRLAVVALAAALVLGVVTYGGAQVNTGGGVSWPPIAFAQRVTYAQLPPAASATGMIVYVTDSNSVTWGAAITGSGASGVALAWSNGTAWTVIGK